ncbi:MAG: S41 family peptidase, partial [Phycisphaerae bacterium]
MPKRNVIWTLAIVAAGVATVLLTRTTEPPEESAVPPVARAYQKIRDRWYFPPDDAVLQQEAVRAMVEQLDEHSSYVAPERIPSFHARLDGRARCVGLLVERVGQVVEIIGSLPGSPAHRASIEPGGRLVAIDGRSAADYTDEEMRKLLEAPDPNTLKLTMIDALGRPRTCELARDEFLIETVTGLTRTPDGPWDYTLDADEKIAYLRIREFVPRATEYLRQALRKLGGTRGIVLDLRDNPGGRIEIGYAVANLFLRNGVIFTRIDRTGRRWAFPAHSAGTQPPTPMVVLINARTASAAELVAGAMSLHDRAVLVGARTCGKGLVQSMIRLDGGLGQVNLTTAEFLVGTGLRIARLPGRESWGLEPH